METIALTRKRRSQRDYSLAFKISVITQVEKGELTYKQAQKHYGIQGRSTVLTWLRKLGTLDWSEPKANYMESKNKTPEQRIKELEEELQQERDRNLLLNTIIDVAEKQHGFSIRKKRSPKQQSNSSKQED
jgi:transposase-like protein